jgi:hypothetical protein
MTAMPKPECLISIDLAIALNHFLYDAGFHKPVYKELGFLCPECHKPVMPIKALRPRNRETRRAIARAHFAHVTKSICQGPASWRAKKGKSNSKVKTKGAGQADATSMPQSD